MRHLHAGNKLGVDASHRTALLRSLAVALIERDSIKTTPARAKELRFLAERTVTLAKRGDLHSRRRILQLLGSNQTFGERNRVKIAIGRIYQDLVPRFRDRMGGYTQILRLPNRRVGDNAEQCIIRYLPPPEKQKEIKKKGDKKDLKTKSKSKAETTSSPKEKVVKRENKKSSKKSQDQNT